MAGVSKTLLYHYFPDGRPELYREVMDRLVTEMVATVREAVGAPTSPEQRVAHLAAAVLGWFGEQPDAYRLLVLEPWGSGDPGVVGQAAAVRARLACELNTLLAPAGARRASPWRPAQGETESLPEPAGLIEAFVPANFGLPTDA